MTHRDDALVVAELIQSLGLRTLDFLAIWRLSVDAYTSRYTAETLSGEVLATIKYHERSSGWSHEHPGTCEVTFGPQPPHMAVRLGEEEEKVREKLSELGVTLLESLPSLLPWHESQGVWRRELSYSKAYLEASPGMHSTILRQIDPSGKYAWSRHITRYTYDLGPMGGERNLADVDHWLEERGVKLLESRAVDSGRVARVGGDLEQGDIGMIGGD